MDTNRRVINELSIKENKLDKNELNAARMLCYLLRHSKDIYQIHMDKNGFVDIDILLYYLKERITTINKEYIDKIVNDDLYTRYSYNMDKDKLRANYGHSNGCNPEYVKVIPPEVLYHGTSLEALESILANGIDFMGRDRIHLTNSREKALVNGRRHGTPINLVLDTKLLLSKGYSFYNVGKSVWTTDKIVEPDFFRIE